MTPTTVHSRVQLASLAERCQLAARRLSDHAHAMGDTHAQHMGWTTAQAPGLLGLAGRTYRDSRFDALRRSA